MTVLFEKVFYIRKNGIIIFTRELERVEAHARGVPVSNQRDLHFIVEIVLQKLKQTEMIILYGSYARNDYVKYDEKSDALR